LGTREERHRDVVEDDLVTVSLAGPDHGVDVLSHCSPHSRPWIGRPNGGHVGTSVVSRARERRTGHGGRSSALRPTPTDTAYTALVSGSAAAESSAARSSSADSSSAASYRVPSGPTRASPRSPSAPGTSPAADSRTVRVNAVVPLRRLCPMALAMTTVAECSLFSPHVSVCSLPRSRTGAPLWSETMTF